MDLRKLISISLRGVSVLAVMVDHTLYPSNAHLAIRLYLTLNRQCLLQLSATNPLHELNDGCHSSSWVSLFLHQQLITPHKIFDDFHKELIAIGQCINIIVELPMDHAQIDT